MEDNDEEMSKSMIRKFGNSEKMQADWHNIEMVLTLSWQ